MPPIAAPDDLWDFASWDGEHQRLLVAHGKDVLVIAPATRTTAGSVRSIGQIDYAHAVLSLPGSDRILVTSKLDDSVRILDGATGNELNRIPVAKGPDATVLSADGRTAYVMAAKAGVISVVDLDRMVETGRIPLKTGLEVAMLPIGMGAGARTAALDPASGRLYLPSARLNPVVEGQPRTVVPGSFRILVMSPG